MKVYRVDNIIFSFKYHFDNYFKDNIEKYRIDEYRDVKHHFNVFIKEDIKIPKGEALGANSPYTIMNDNMRFFFHKNNANNNLRVLIEHDLSYKNINIYLNKNEVKDLINAEYVFSGIIFLELAQYLSYLPLHATAIKKGEDVILFSAPSGTGKSTHRKYWQEVFEDITIINDDKPLLSFSNNNKNNILVHGSPFSGEDALNSNESGKLKAIVFLKQGLSNEIRVLSKDEKIKELIRNTVTPKLDYLWDQVLQQIEHIIDKVPILELSATNNIDAVIAIHNYLYGG